MSSTIPPTSQARIDGPGYTNQAVAALVPGQVADNLITAAKVARAGNPQGVAPQVDRDTFRNLQQYLADHRDARPAIEAAIASRGNRDERSIAGDAVSFAANGLRNAELARMNQEAAQQLLRGQSDAMARLGLGADAMAAGQLGGGLAPANEPGATATAQGAQVAVSDAVAGYLDAARVGNLRGADGQTAPGYLAVQSASYQRYCEAKALDPRSSASWGEFDGDMQRLAKSMGVRGTALQGVAQHNTFADFDTVKHRLGLG